MEEAAMARQAVFKYVSSYYKRVLQPDFKIFYPPPESNVWQMTDLLPEKPGNVADLLDKFENKIELDGYHEGSGRTLSGYNPNCGNHPSGLAALFMMLAGIHNKKEWRSLDQTVLRWLMDTVGFDKSASGFFTSGGSASTAVAMMAAREASRVPIVSSDRMVLYLTHTTHNCAEKALRVVGLGEINFRRVLHDKKRKMVVSDLENKIKEDIENKLNPFMVIATMGEVNSGAIDPLEGIAAVAAKYGVWFHVDAAYGGCFLMCETVKHKSRGINSADSVIMNLHKGLFQPFSSSAVLFKKGASPQLFTSKNKGAEGVNPLEEKQPFHGFPAWMFLNVFGVKHIQNLLLEKCMLCHYLYRYLALCPGLSVPIESELSKLLFALEDENNDVHKANKKTEKLCQELNSEGIIAVDTTVVDGRVYIHMCVSSLRSHFREIECFLLTLKAIAADCFNLVFPDIQNVISQETQNQLKTIGEFYDTVEKRMSEEQVSEAVAEAAENFRQGGLLPTEDSFLFKILSETKVDELMGTTSLFTQKASSTNNIESERGSESFFNIPQDSKSMFEITHDVFGYPPSEQESKPLLPEGVDQGILEPAILGTFLMKCFNQCCPMWAFTPGGIELEEMIIDWLATVAGFSTSSKGVLCDDSRMADTLCLTAARSTKLPTARMYERAVVYGSEDSLRSLSQSLHVVGLSGCQKVVVESTDGELDIDSLVVRIQDDFEGITERNIPFLVLLSIGATGLEAKPDKLRNLMTLCQKKGVWVHIRVKDGAPFLLSDLGPCHVMKESGLAEADSISIDLTECLCQPQTVAAALVQDHNLLRKSLEPQSASPYLPDLVDVKFEPSSYTLELSRPMRPVPLWFAMYLLGAERIRQHIANLRNLK